MPAVIDREGIKHPIHAHIDSAAAVPLSTEIVAFAIHGKKDLVQVPRVAGLGAAAELIVIGLAKLPAPIPHGFIARMTGDLIQRVRLQLFGDLPCAILFCTHGATVKLTLSSGLSGGICAMS